MAQIEIRQLSFYFPGRETPALDQVSLSVEEGEFILLCGPTGSGKTTLLRLLKPGIEPAGRVQGEILYEGLPFSRYEEKKLSAEIGMVFQNPESQIVLDTVQQELAFSLENFGFDVGVMRQRIAEMAHFFGLDNLMQSSVHHLSGGQKQFLNLASVLVLHPKVLLLDEPTAQLDPVSSRGLIQLIYRLNREFSITVLLSEHRLEELFPLADRAVFLEKGRVRHCGPPREIILDMAREKEEGIHSYLPPAARLFIALEDGEGSPQRVPLSIREAKRWFLAKAESLPLVERVAAGPEGKTGEKRKKGETEQKRKKEGTSDKSDIEKIGEKGEEGEILLECREICFQYGKNHPPVLKNLSLAVRQGEIAAILGGNGSGKSTLLKIMAGLLSPQLGTVRLKGKKLGKQKEQHRSVPVAYLPQDPRLCFLLPTVLEELEQAAAHLDPLTRRREIDKWLSRFGLEEAILSRHPFDLSGGEQQKAALMIGLLSEPSLILLDEPAKGLDPVSRRHFAGLLRELNGAGQTIVLVTHDVEFAAEVAHRCLLLFDGEIAVAAEPRVFFSRHFFYTTSVNRIVRDRLPLALTVEDVVDSCGKRS